MKIQLQYAGTSIENHFSPMQVELDAPPRTHDVVVLNAREYWVYRVVWCPQAVHGKCCVELMAPGEGGSEY